MRSNSITRGRNGKKSLFPLHCLPTKPTQMIVQHRNSGSSCSTYNNQQQLKILEAQMKFVKKYNKNYI